MSSIVERDFVMRMVKQLVEVLARALKLALTGKHEEAQTVLEAGCLTVLGMDYRTLAVVDAASAADLLGSPARVLAFAKLVAGMAEVARARGEVAKAASHAQHALELSLEALRRAPTSVEARELALELRPQVDLGLVPARYAATLSALPGIPAGA